jgi:hypothetical protein
MSTPLILACFWVLAATGIAFLPMKRQMVPGFALLLAAPVLIVWIGAAHGWLFAVAGLAAFLSMFRRPLMYFARKAMGRA